MKPSTAVAMANLIQQIRQTIPFDLPDSVICSGICKGCSKKLLDYLESEIDSWTDRLENGVTPNLGDINALAKSSKKIFMVLQKNRLV